MEEQEVVGQEVQSQETQDLDPFVAEIRGAVKESQEAVEEVFNVGADDEVLQKATGAEEETEEQEQSEEDQTAEVDVEAKIAEFERKLEENEELTEEELKFASDHGYELEDEPAESQEEKKEGEEREQDTEESKMWIPPKSLDAVQRMAPGRIENASQYEEAVIAQASQLAGIADAFKEAQVRSPEAAGVIQDVLDGKDLMASLSARFPELKEIAPKEGDDNYQDYEDKRVEMRLQAERKKQQEAKMAENQKQAAALVADFVKEKKFTPDDQDKYLRTFDHMIRTYNETGIPPKELLSAVYKEMFYDRDVKLAEKRGLREGGNRKFQKKKAAQTTRPAAPTGSGGSIKSNKKFKYKDNATKHLDDVLKIK